MQAFDLPRTAPEIEALLRGAQVYPRSVQAAGGELLCFAKDAHQHYLLAIFNPQLPPFMRDSFSGEVQDLSSAAAIKWCFPSHSNAKKLRALFPWTAPHTLSTTPTLPVRDLIGLAAPAILQAHAAQKYDFALAFEAAPEELAALSRTMDEALDTVTFAIFQENYRHPWAMRAADLSDAGDEELYEKLGFTEFSFAGDVTDFRPAAQEEWLDAALQTVAQASPELFDEIEAAGNDFSNWWTAKTESGAWCFRDRVYRLLLDNEATHHQFIRAAAERLFVDFQNDPLRNE
jgi:hypothetical protein